MKTPDYKTLLYMQGLGSPVDELIEARQYNAIKRNLEALSDYELMYYHCKLLKMPRGTYDRAGLIMAMFHNAITEYEAMQARLQESQEAQDRRDRQKRLEGVGLACLVYFLVLCALAVGVCLWAWFRWR